MSRLSILLALVLLCGCKPASPDEHRDPPSPDLHADQPQPSPSAERQAERQAALEAAFEARLRSDEGFGLTYVSGLGFNHPVGVVCEAPALHMKGGLQGPSGYGVSDVVGADDPADLDRKRKAALRRNLGIIERADFPYPDVCRPWRSEDRMVLGGVAPEGWPSGTAPARAVTGPARDLHDAARRGTVEEVAAWAARTPDIDGADSFMRSPLAWAVARGRTEIVQRLLALGASPDAGIAPVHETPRWIAARMGRVDLYGLFPDAVTDTAGDGRLLRAAIDGGSAPIVRRVLAQSHAKRDWATATARATARKDDVILSLVLDAGGPDAVAGLLIAAVQAGDPRRLDLAVRKGADVRTVRYPSLSLLGLAVLGRQPNADQIVSRLLEAGVRVNELTLSNGFGPHEASETPLTILVSEGWREVDASNREGAERQFRILDQLLRARANLRVRDHDGLPLAILATVGQYADVERGTAMTGNDLLPDAWMRRLLRAGMDINAVAHGRTALDWAIAVNGPDSENARRLRGYGAKRASEL